MNFQISLSGLNVAQQAIDLIATNIANAGTKGYHRQELNVAPIEFNATNVVTLAGAEVIGVRRAIDQMLERQILRVECQMGQISQELMTLQLVERTLGDIDSNRLGLALNGFFDSLRELSAHPNNAGYQCSVVEAGTALANEFQNMATFTQELDGHILLQADIIVQQVNDLATEIADLNAEINAAILRGNDANVMQDRRDQAIAELAGLVEIQADAGGALEGQVNVRVGGAPLVMGGQTIELEVTTDSNNTLGLAGAGSSTLLAGIDQGQLGALFTLKNSLLADITDSLDLLAGQVIKAVNEYHVQGVGTSGSFAELSGWAVGLSTAKLSELSSDISLGTLQLRVINQLTGEITIERVEVDDLDTTFGQFATTLSNLDNITAWISGSALHIQAATNYKFDFLPVCSGQYDPGTWDPVNNTAQIAISGIFEGSANEDFTVTVVGGGGVGIDEGLKLLVEDALSEKVAEFNVGLGYTPGDVLTLDNGITLTVSAGDFVVDDSFTLHGVADSDSANILTSVGINTFFSGSSASNIAICQDVIADPGRVATAMSDTMTDNRNIVRLGNIADQQIAALGNLTPSDHYRMLAAGIGRDVSVRFAKKTALQIVSNQLANQRDTISGVDINAEAAKMLLFEQMFQAMAKVLSVQNEALQSLMAIV